MQYAICYHIICYTSSFSSCYYDHTNINTSYNRICDKITTISSEQSICSFVYFPGVFNLSLLWINCVRLTGKFTLVCMNTVSPNAGCVTMQSGLRAPFKLSDSCVLCCDLFVNHKIGQLLN